MRSIGALLLTTLFALSALSQNTSLDGAEIYHRLKKLQNTTRVLYLAAHPDDENTRVISWLENEKGARTAYLSLTRGDGGQNLIGTELGAKLGVLRTQELMQARAIDGGEQFFTRAVDFGYSKTADETFRQWNKEEVLADVVWVLRKFQPDLIITRFPADARGGHGHHTASAILALEAFDQAGDPTKFREQLQYLNTWQPKRLFWNHSTWWNQDLDSIAAADDRYSVIDVGSYLPHLGLSCNELASLSRTQHKSQGFGVSVDRGSRKEYLQLLRGEAPKEHIFEDIPQGWARYGWPEGDARLKEVMGKFQIEKPYLIAEDLMVLLQESEAITNAYQKNYFQNAVQELFRAVTGLHLELLAKQEYITTGVDAQLEMHYVNRSPLELQYFKGLGTKASDETNQKSNSADRLEELFGQKGPLPFNEEVSRSVNIEKVSTEISQPYWLEHAYGTMFKVPNQLLIGEPENSPALELMVPIALNDKVIMLPVRAQYKFSDRVEGEIKNPLMVVPAFTVNPAAKNLIFVNEQPQELLLDVKAFEKGSHNFTVKAPGWNIKPEMITLNFSEPEQVQTVALKVWPQKKNATTAALSFTSAKSQEALQSITEINYGHIEKRVVFEEAQVKLVKIDLAKNGERIGYIAGAGDEVPAAMEQMGYQVEMLTEAAIKNQDLGEYQAIVAGIRAYNTQAWLPTVKDKLMQYVAGGGTYIVQYNTASRDLLSQDIGPKPFKLSRERVTEEKAPARFTEPVHPILTRPNVLSNQDFEGWLQERGLYFAGEWDPAYATPLAWHDANEPDRLGGLLVTQHGQGVFIYTGISFFRELPAGVEGAYRLWANLLSYKP